MIVVKGGKFRFTPKKLQAALMKQFAEVGQIGARRMEQEAKMFLSERIGVGIRGPVSKSTGTLEDGIIGFFTVGKDAVFAGVTATALELGQWESSIGESGEAERATMAPPFDYAGVVEGGSGIFGPLRKPIRAKSAKNLRFFTGEYREARGGFRRVVYSSREVAGQKGKNFLGDAILTSLPSIVKLIQNVGRNIKITDVVRWK